VGATARAVHGRRIHKRFRARPTDRLRELSRRRTEPTQTRWSRF
jgi:hypothetical protein